MSIFCLVCVWLFYKRINIDACHTSLHRFLSNSFTSSLFTCLLASLMPYTIWTNTQKQFMICVYNSSKNDFLLKKSTKQCSNLKKVVISTIQYMHVHISILRSCANENHSSLSNKNSYTNEWINRYYSKLLMNLKKKCKNDNHEK